MTPEGRRLALVNEATRYVVVQCLRPKEGLSTTLYESVVRRETLSGTIAEYFRPNAIKAETSIEPGDEIQVLEVDHEHGFIHALITLKRGNRYEINRIIPLDEHYSNAHNFIVAPLLSEGGIAAEESDSPTPVSDSSAEIVASHEVSESQAPNFYIAV